MKVILLGGGDLGSGVAFRLHKAQIPFLILELPQPLTVRRTVAFSEAVHQKEVEVEGIKCELVDKIHKLSNWDNNETIPLIIDPTLELLPVLNPLVIIDARMKKLPPEYNMNAAQLIIGIGPGFTTGIDCHCVIETNRGHSLGKVIWTGGSEQDTGMPEAVQSFSLSRVLRTPCDGVFQSQRKIGDIVRVGDEIGKVNGELINTPFKGLIRGLLANETKVKSGIKVGDLDPRCDISLIHTISDKSRAIGGAVLEAILSKEDIREQIWS